VSVIRLTVVVVSVVVVQSVVVTWCSSYMCCCCSLMTQWVFSRGVNDQTHCCSSECSSNTGVVVTRVAVVA